MTVPSPVVIDTFQQIETIADAIVSAGDRRRVLVFSDFDGTVCDFALKPEEAVLTPERRALLNRVAHLPGITVAIVSGRRLPDIRVRADVGMDAFYAGLHGLEIQWKGATVIHEGVFATERLLADLAEELRTRLADVPGVIVEDKRFSLALHYRAATEAYRQMAEDIFAELANPYLEAGKLKEMQGNCVRELLPNISWNKGNAVRKIRAEVERQCGELVWPVYLGDDVTDEDAFGALGDDGVTIVVGVRPSCARYRVEHPAAVAGLLALVCERWRRRPETSVLTPCDDRLPASASA